MTIVSQDREAKEATARFLTAGADITGAAYGAAAGGMLGGPVGAGLGATIGGLLGAAVKEFAHRVLSWREEVRVGATLHYVTQACNERLEAGDELRTDGFFDLSDKGRSRADEITEGVLIAAQRQHEERKIEFLGYLLANIAFESQVDAHLASWSVKIANELTWAQYCILAIVGGSGDVSFPVFHRHDKAPNWSSFGINEQILSLAQREIIGAEPPKNPVLGLPYPNLNPGDQRLRGSGRLLHDLMWLDRIPDAYRANIVRLLVEP